MTARAGWPVWPLAAAVVVVPIVAVTLAATIAMSQQLVPACVPFIDGCTSVSATGRYPPASFVFKGIMLPYATLLALYWWAVVTWLRDLPGVAPWRNANLCLALTWFSALALVVYAVTLGSRGELYEFMRRFGIYFYFLFTVVGQVMCALRMRAAVGTRAAGTWQLATAVAMLAAGVLLLVLKAILDDPDAAENIIEWTFGLLMLLNLGAVVGPLRRADARIQLVTTR